MNPAPEGPLSGHSPYHHSLGPAGGLSPQPSMYDSGTSRGAPLPVDFTHYRPAARSVLLPAYESPYAENRRKRSFSQATSDETPATQPLRSNGAIDPSLAAMLNPSPGSSMPQRPKEPQATTPNRREELEREAARIREMLTAKEREIAALAER